MTIGLSLDTQALLKLIELDPTFAVNVKTSILENIARRHVRGVDADIERAMAAAGADAVNVVAAKFGTYKNAYRHSFKLNDTVLSSIREQAGLQANEAINAVVSGLIDEAVKEKMKGLEAKINEHVAYAMRTFTEQAVTKAVSDRISEVMLALKGSSAS